MLKFSCVGCGAFYAGEACKHFATRICEHFSSCKHSLCSDEYFDILDSASTSFKLKIKETPATDPLGVAFFIPPLNIQFIIFILISLCYARPTFSLFQLILKYYYFYHILLTIYCSFSTGILVKRTMEFVSSKTKFQ